MTTVKANNKNHYFNIREYPANHYTLYPILNKKYYDHYKNQKATDWTVEEVCPLLEKDKDHFHDKLNENDEEKVEPKKAIMQVNWKQFKKLDKL